MGKLVKEAATTAEIKFNYQEKEKREQQTFN